MEEHAGQDGEKRGVKSDVAAEEGRDSGGNSGIGQHEGLVLMRRQS